MMPNRFRRRLAARAPHRRAGHAEVEPHG
jgi:hypothetical protein